MAGRINTERLLGAHRYVRFHSAAGVPATIQLQIMHGLHGDRALDYDQLVRLDEELIREKNRAEKDQITSLPVQKATKEDQELRCCVCMCDVEEGEELRVLPCSHKYHKACIDGKLIFNFLLHTLIFVSFPNCFSNLLCLALNASYFVFLRVAYVQWMLPS